MSDLKAAMEAFRRWKQTPAGKKHIEEAYLMARQKIDSVACESGAWVSAASSDDMRLPNYSYLQAEPPPPHQNFNPDGTPSPSLELEGKYSSLEADVLDGWELLLEVKGDEGAEMVNLTRAQALELARWITETLK